MAKKSGGLIGLLKGLVIFAVVVFGLAIAVYVGVKATTGIDILKAINQIKAVQTAPSEEEIVVDKYNDNDIIVTFDTMFGAGSGERIYAENSEGVRVFVKEEFGKEPLVATTKLDGKQIAGLINVAFHSLDQRAFGLSNSDVEILSIELSNLQSNGEFDMKVSLKLNFEATKLDIKENGNLITKIIRNFIPDTVYLVSDFTVKCNSASEFVFVKNNSIEVNGMNEEEASEIHKIIKKFISKDQDLVEMINKNITILLFGDSTATDSEGFLTCLPGTNTNVILDSEQVKIVINKE